MTYHFVYFPAYSQFSDKFNFPAIYCDHSPELSLHIQYVISNITSHPHISLPWSWTHQICWMKSVFQAHPDFAGIISEKIKIPLAGWNQPSCRYHAFLVKLWVIMLIIQEFKCEWTRSSCEICEQVPIFLKIALKYFLTSTLETYFISPLADFLGELKHFL